MTELRKRMIEDMQLAGLAQGTQEAYIRAVRQLAAHFRLSPDRLSERQLRDYLIHLRNVRGIAKGTFQQHFFAIKFLFVNTLAYDWPLLTKKSPPTPSPAPARHPQRPGLPPPAKAGRPSACSPNSSRVSVTYPTSSRPE